MPRSPAYGQILTKVKAGGSILDLGCCLGHDLRCLAAGGAPTIQMSASDLVQEFWKIGYDLFRDKEKFKARFYQANIFDRASSLQALEGKMDIIYLDSFLHLFDWNEQLDVLNAIVKMSKGNTMVARYQIGLVHGQAASNESKNQTKICSFHDPETIARLWAETGHNTGTKRIVRSSLDSMTAMMLKKRDYEWLGSDARALSFEAVRHSYIILYKSS